MKEIITQDLNGPNEAVAAAVGGLELVQGTRDEYTQHEALVEGFLGAEQTHSSQNNSESVQLQAAPNIGRSAFFNMRKGIAGTMASAVALLGAGFATSAGAEATVPDSGGTIAARTDFGTPFRHLCTPAADAPFSGDAATSLNANNDCVRVLSGNDFFEAAVLANDINPGGAMNVCEVQSSTDLATVVVDLNDKMSTNIVVKRGATGSFEFTYKACSNNNPEQSDTAKVRVEIVPTLPVIVRKLKSKSKVGGPFTVTNPNHEGAMTVIWGDGTVLLWHDQTKKKYTHLKKTLVRGYLELSQSAFAGEVPLKFRKHKRNTN